MAHLITQFDIETICKGKPNNWEWPYPPDPTGWGLPINILIEFRENTRDWRCGVCNKKNPFNYTVCFSSEDHPYLPVGDYCWECLLKTEENHIQGMALTRLPLYINHVWITFVAEKIFKDRFSEGVSDV